MFEIAAIPNASRDASLSRRRFLTVAGVAIGFAGAGAAETNRPEATWRGRALGADAAIILAGLPDAEAQTILDACAAELARLDGLFSRDNPLSALSILNRTGRLDAPDPDFVAALRLAGEVRLDTGGAFDPTLQPLLELYQPNVLGAQQASLTQPSVAQIARAKARVGFHRVKVSHDRVSTPPGVKLTLDGLARGFAADKIATLLKARGVLHGLVDTGEYAALGRPSGRAGWPIAIADPRQAGRTLDRVALSETAIATSNAHTNISEPAGRRHVVDPRTGRVAERYLSVSVVHHDPTLADALATAFHLMSEDGIRAYRDNICGVSALLLRRDGEVVRI